MMMRFIHIITGVVFCCVVGGCFSLESRTGNLFLSTRGNIEWMMNSHSRPNMAVGMSIIMNPFIFLSTFTAAPIWDVLCIPYDIRTSIEEGTEIVVLDDSFSPIDGARIRIKYHHVIFSNSGKTNIDGICHTGIKLSAVDLANVSVQKEGYYPLNKLWRPSDGDNTCVQTAVLSKVECPIQLKFHEERLLECLNVIWKESEDYGWRTVKKQNNQVEYDFVVGDWLPPYGDGKESDAIFFFENNDKGSFLRVEFLGDGNGVVKAMQKHGTGVLMKQAPPDGYQKHHVVTKGDSADQMGLYFKIRGSLYGKLCRDINLEENLKNENPDIKPKRTTCFYPDGQWRKKITFRYFLNTNKNDRNLEQKRNINYWRHKQCEP